MEYNAVGNDGSGARDQHSYYEYAILSPLFLTKGPLTLIEQVKLEFNWPSPRFLRIRHTLAMTSKQ
jgi:hypothetical protein